jgi:hypothetical protein
MDDNNSDNNTVTYEWANNPAAKMARIIHYTQVDMTTDVLQIPGGRRLRNDEDLLRHTRTIIDTIRNINQTAVGRVAIALIEQLFDVPTIAMGIREHLPVATITYFTSPDCPDIHFLPEILCRIFRPCLYHEDRLGDAEIDAEMNALGLYTYRQITIATYPDIARDLGLL